MNLRNELERRIAEALAAAGAPAGMPALAAPSKRAEFGDYQANGCMAAAKGLKVPPRQLAEKVLAAARLNDLAAKVEIAGPGFINVTLRDDWLAGQLSARLADQRLGVDRPARPQTVVVDYSSPNLAKEMHVGHLRSTIIGDALARVLHFLGHRVIRQNHVGDWGTQFGKLLGYMVRRWFGWDLKSLLEGNTQREAIDKPISDLDSFYVAANREAENDPDFDRECRRLVVELQNGNPITRDWWNIYKRKTITHCQEIYNRLGVLLTEADVRGESAYNDDLPEVVADLESAGLLRESQGAQCVFPEGFKDKEGNDLPVIVQKSDGGYLYATTDLAALRYRAGKLKADRILYVTDSRQALHFRQVFAVALATGFVPAGVCLEHVGFGMMLGSDNRPFKTREGGTVKLMDLLDEAEQRARAVVERKNPDLPDDRKAEVARVVGMGAVKYADLSQNRSSDYVFSWDKMLALEGNTAPYMQYAYARIRSIFRRGEGEEVSTEEARQGAEPLRAATARERETHLAPAGAILIDHPAERALAVRLAQFPETVEAVAADCLPNLLCAYLYDLAGAFMGFYESCPVLKAEGPVRAARLALCDLTARTIRTGLNLLGIQTLEQM